MAVQRAKKRTAKKPAKKLAKKAVRQTAKPARKRAKPHRSSLPKEQRPPKEVTRDLFLIWRAPRIGTRNPENLTNPVWTWLARNPEMSAWSANQHFQGPSSFAVGKCFCNQRFGQSTTTLPDGTTVAIAGEHEDYYDPDFFIYNDVIVRRPSGDIALYGYPHQVFPPTDFHTATLAGEDIVIIGCLGYTSQRKPGVTPVYVLSTRTWSMKEQVTTGELPGWIHRHEARLSDDGKTVVISGGERTTLVGDEPATTDNFDDWALDLGTWAWSRVVHRPFRQWKLSRADGKANGLFDIGSVATFRAGQHAWEREQIERGEKQLGYKPDLALYDQRYCPPVEHTVVPTESGYPLVVQVLIDGVTVRYCEDSFSVKITFEGDVDPAIAAVLVEDARSKLAALEHAEYVARQVQ